MTGPAALNRRGWLCYVNKLLLVALATQLMYKNSITVKLTTTNYWISLQARRHCVSLRLTEAPTSDYFLQTLDQLGRSQSAFYCPLMIVMLRPLEIVAGIKLMLNGNVYDMVETANELRTDGISEYFLYHYGTISGVFLSALWWFLLLLWRNLFSTWMLSTVEEYLTVWLWWIDRETPRDRLPIMALTPFNVRYKKNSV